MLKHGALDKEIMFTYTTISDTTMDTISEENILTTHNEHKKQNGFIENNEKQQNHVDSSWDLYIRLCQLYVDGGAAALKSTFNQIHPPFTLAERLGKPEIYKPIRRLRLRGLITPKQWELLYPISKKTVSSSDYDPILLYLLLKSVCRLPSPYPNGWDEMPLTEDKSMAADIVRMKFYRNSIMKLDKDAVDEKLFKDLWKQMLEVIIRLGGNIVAKLSARIEKERPDEKAQNQILSEMKQWHTLATEIENKERELAEIAEIKTGRQEVSKLTQPVNIQSNATSADANHDEDEDEDDADGDDASEKGAVKNKYSKQAQLAQQEEEEIIYEVTKSVEKDILEKYSKQLIDNLKAEEIVPKLVQRGVLTHEEKSKISLVMRNADRVRMVIDMLAEKSGKAFDNFCDIIKFKHKSLYNKLVETKQTPLLIGRPDECTQCSEALKMKYQAVYSKCLPILWHDSVYAPIHDFYVPPQIVDLLGREIDSNELFSSYPGNEFPQRIVIEGAGGVGKTTFCRHIAYEWAVGNMKWSEKFKLVFHIDIRMIHKKSKELEDVVLEQCLPFSFKKSREEITNMLKKHQKNTLFIVDNVVTEKQINALSLIFVDSNKYPEASVIAMISTNFMTNRLRQHFDTKMVMLGMKENNQEEIIESYINLTQQPRENFEPLLNEINSDDSNLVKVIALNPTYCLAMCLICEQEGEIDFTTGTSIMQEFMIAIAKLYCQTFNVLYQTDIPDIVSKSILVLEEVAFNAVKFHSESMETETIVAQFENREFLNFGLLTVFIAGQRSLPVENFMFTNTVIQDFLAARYLSKVDMDEFIDHTEQLVSDPYLHNVCVHFCGLLQHDDEQETMQELFSNLASRNMSMTREMSFLDECSTDISSKPTSAKSNFTVGKSSFRSKWSARSTMSQESVEGRILDYRLSFECLNECDGREDVMKFIVDSLPKKLYMRSRDIAARQWIGGLSQIVKADTPSLIEIDIRLDHLGEYNIHALRELACDIEKSRNIKTLKLRWTKENLLAQFLAIVYGNNRSISTLKIYDESNMTDDAINATVWANIFAAQFGMRFVKVFAFVCCKNPALVTAIIRNTPDSLQELYLNNCTLDLISAQELADKLDISTRLKHLSLQSTLFKKADFIHIAKGLKHNRTLVDLNVSHCGLEHSSVSPLLEALQFNKSIRKLDLSRNTLSNDAVKDIVQTLNTNNTLLELNVRDCCLTDWAKIYFSEKKRANLLILGINLRRPASSYYMASR